MKNLWKFLAIIVLVCFVCFASFLNCGGGDGDGILGNEDDDAVTAKVGTACFNENEFACEEGAEDGDYALHCEPAYGGGFAWTVYHDRICVDGEVRGRSYVDGDDSDYYGDDSYGDDVDGDDSTVDDFPLESDQDVSECINGGPSRNVEVEGDEWFEFSASGSCAVRDNFITIAKVNASEDYVDNGVYVRAEGMFNINSLNSGVIELEPVNGTSEPCPGVFNRGSGTFFVDAKFSNVPDGQENRLVLYVYDATYLGEVNADRLLSCEFDLELK